jgi:antitoxin (DNA-binding transcriptional repressor) of toxin-antitoxin stability system
MKNVELNRRVLFMLYYPQEKERQRLMVYQVNYDDPKIHLDELINAALRGDKVIIIGKEGKQMVELVPVKHGQRRMFGSAKGRINIAKDFNHPLADFNAYMS